MSHKKTVDPCRSRTRIAILTLLVLLLAWPLAAAQKPEPAAKIEAAASLFTFAPALAYEQVRVTLSGPGGFEVVRTFGADEAPIVDLPGADGLYKYELRFSPVLSRDDHKLLAAARANGVDVPEMRQSAERLVQSGSFLVADGSVVGDQDEPQADKVVLTNANGVIRNALCVGVDCPDAPAFGDSSVLMMENNNRIKFGDTSVSPFPANDWEIEANSSLSGGASYLGFNDCGSADNDGDCATDLVFAVEAGVRASALYVESDGDVGIGTSNPVLDLHIVTGNSPAIRLDQDGSGGFAPQAWDLAGNETSFFIRDATHGSTLPFRIQPSAPSNSVFIASTGNVGMGTASPSASLHLRRTDGTAQALVEEASATETARDLIKLQNNGTARISVTDTSPDGEEWQFAVNGAANAFVITNQGSGATEFSLIKANAGGATAGDLTIIGDIFTGGGTCGGGCDALFQGEVESIEDHAAYMWENSHLPGVGPTRPDEPWNLTEKTGGILNELEKAHIYIAQLDSGLKDRDSQIAKLSQDLDAKEARIAQLEAALARIETLIESR
jgi:hypothetical protein